MSRISDWAAAAEGGARLCYYEGFLACDAADPDTDTFVRKRLERMRDEVQDLVACGMVRAVQVRVGENRFRYLAERTTRLDDEPLPLAA